jgi:hypothetical protein
VCYKFIELKLIWNMRAAALHEYVRDPRAAIICGPILIMRWRAEREREKSTRQFRTRNEFFMTSLVTVNFQVQFNMYASSRE